MLAMGPNDLQRAAKMRRLAASGGARTLREESGLSLRAVAGAVKVTPSTLSLWETGRSQPRLAHALRWAKVLERIKVAQ